jgi:hypothetical protein
VIDVILVVCDDPRHRKTQAVVNYDLTTPEASHEWHPRYTRPQSSGKPPAGTRHGREVVACKRCGRRVVVTYAKLDAALDKLAEHGVATISLAALARML